MLRLAYSVDHCFGSRTAAGYPDRVVSLLFLVSGVVQMTLSTALFIDVYLCFSHQEALYTFPTESPALAAVLGVISLAIGGLHAWKGWNRRHEASYATIFLSLMKFLFSLMIIVYSTSVVRHARGELTRVIACVFIVCCCLLALPEPYVSWLLFRCCRSFSLTKLFFRLSDDTRRIVNENTLDGMPGDGTLASSCQDAIGNEKGDGLAPYPLSLLHSSRGSCLGVVPALSPLPFTGPCSPASSVRVRLGDGQSTSVQMDPLDHMTVDPRSLHLLTKPIHDNLSSHAMQSRSGCRNEAFSEDIV